ncbi:hypothetical protein A4A49_40203 [Nicotiana attenuata]|uniref:Uncharacterized protein n=1 Tax=Nicotiana attenuata TaxID=49451 RepID=A0A1J6JTD9_NICAT|nr:hypothetical protein A4A49_40203 [Nicotiana attenuata]
MVPNSSDSQQIIAEGRRQINTIDAVQTANKLAALQTEEESTEGNQLAIVEAGDTTPIQKELNPGAAIFTPKSTGVASSKRDIAGSNSREIQVIKATATTGNESTSQWVNRTFSVRNVTTNQSYQEIQSQSLDMSTILEQENLKDKVTFSGGKLWCEQHEEESDEGEFLEGHEDVEEVKDKDPDLEEQSVNGKSGRIEGQSAGEGDKVMIADEQVPQVEQISNQKLSSNINPSNIGLIEIIDQNNDTGDPKQLGDNGDVVQQQQKEVIQKDSEKLHSSKPQILGDKTVAMTQYEDLRCKPNSKTVAEEMMNKIGNKSLIPKHAQNQIIRLSAKFKQQVWSFICPESNWAKGNR